MEKNRQTALITGASSGIGLELAKLFAKNKFNLVLVARGEAALREVANSLQKEFGIKITVLVEDLSKKGTAQKIYDNLKSNSVHIDILVNNAGFGDNVVFSQSSMERINDMINVNILALTQLTRLFLPDMIEKGHGKVLEVASVAGFVSGPFMAVYYASKAYVLSLSVALSAELKGTGVTLSVLCPGPTRTNFANVANVREELLFNNPLVMSSERVAKIGFKGLMRGKTIIIPGTMNKIEAFLTRFFSKGFVADLMKRVQKAA